MIPVAVQAAWRAAKRVRRLQQQALAAERLAELGTLTGGLAHEIKNPLSTIGLNIQLIDEDLRAVADLQAPAAAAPNQASHFLRRIQHRFDSLRREAQRLRDILDDFLRFAGRLQLDLALTDVNALIDDLVDFFGPQAAAAQIQLRTQLAATPPAVPADAGLLKQAMLNLMINATQAMVGARDHTVHGGSDELIVRTERQKSMGQEWLLIHVTDTGRGLAPEASGKIFRPYFSTKSGGTGLGLPTARRIIEEHGGAICVHSEPGRGCDFVISLPADSQAPPNEAEDSTGGATKA